MEKLAKSQDPNDMIALINQLMETYKDNINNAIKVFIPLINEDPQSVDKYAQILATLSLCTNQVFDPKLVQIKNNSLFTYMRLMGLFPDHIIEEMNKTNKRADFIGYGKKKIFERLGKLSMCFQNPANPEEKKWKSFGTGKITIFESSKGYSLFIRQIESNVLQLYLIIGADLDPKIDGDKKVLFNGIGLHDHVQHESSIELENAEDASALIAAMEEGVKKHTEASEGITIEAGSEIGVLKNAFDGEHLDEILFVARARVFDLFGGQWEEFGRGELHINKSPECFRVLLWRIDTGAAALNSRLTETTAPSRAGDRCMKIAALIEGELRPVLIMFASEAVRDQAMEWMEKVITAQ